AMWYHAFLAERNDVIDLDLAPRIGVVEKEHHRGLFVDGFTQLVSRFDLDHLDTAVAHSVIVAVAMRLLDDHLALHPRAGQVGNAPDPVGIFTGDAGRR